MRKMRLLRSVLLSALVFLFLSSFWTAARVLALDPSPQEEAGISCLETIVVSPDTPADALLPSAVLHAACRNATAAEFPVRCQQAALALRSHEPRAPPRDTLLI